MSELIAREQQIGQLNTLLEQAFQGRLQIVFVAGEAGIGKTSLITTFAQQAATRNPDLHIASGHCSQVAGSQQEPYLPFVQIFESIAESQKGHAQWDRWRKGLVEVAPAWISLVPGGNVLVAVIKTVDWSKREFSDQNQGKDLSQHAVQYANALRFSAKDHPLLLWVDDVHWADNATLDLISFLADQLSTTRIMLILTYRPADVLSLAAGGTHPARRLIQKLNRYEQCKEIELVGFAEDDVKDFLVRSGHAFPESFVLRLQQRSGGNPLFLREYINLLHARHLVQRKDGVFVLSQSGIELDIPVTVQAVIQQRLDLVPNDLRQLLTYASVQGEHFWSQILADISEISDLVVLDKLNRLEKVHGLIRESPEGNQLGDGGTQYLFVHALLQQAVYSDLSGGQRRQLHLKIAQIIEGICGLEIALYANQLAVHFERGGNLLKATKYYLQAARNALSVMAFDDALTQTAGVNRICQQLDEDSPALQQHIEALLVEAEVHTLKADYLALTLTCDEGERQCEQTGLTEQHAHFLYYRATVLDRNHREAEAINVTRRAIAMLGSDPSDRHLQAKLYAWLGNFDPSLSLAEIDPALDMALTISKSNNFKDIITQVLFHRAWASMNYTFQTEQAVSYARQAIQIAQEEKLTGVEVECHRVLAYALRRLERGGEALAHIEQAVELAKRYGLPLSLHRSLCGLAIATREVREDWPQSIKILGEAKEVARLYKFATMSDVLGSLFDFYLGLGQWSEAYQTLSELGGAIDASAARPQADHLYREGKAAHPQGRFEEASLNYQKVLTEYIERTPTYTEDDHKAQTYLGLALVASGEWQQSKEHLEQACDYWRDKNDDPFAHCLRGLAKIDLAEGRVDLALERLREALAAVENDYSEDSIWPVWQTVSLDLGVALLAAGDAQAALPHAQFAYDKFKKWGHFLLGEAAFAVGQMFVAQGRSDLAVTYLREARQEWQRLELAYHFPEWDAFVTAHSLAV